MKILRGGRWTNVLDPAAQRHRAGPVGVGLQADPDGRRAVASLLLLVVRAVVEVGDQDADCCARERAHDDVGREVLARANPLVADECGEQRARCERDPRPRVARRPLRVNAR